MSKRGNMNEETKTFVDSMLNNLTQLINIEEEKPNYDIFFMVNLKFTRQFILEFAEKNGYEVKNG